jgi:hypothetical protein
MKDFITLQITCLAFTAAFWFSFVDFVLRGGGWNETWLKAGIFAGHLEKNELAGWWFGSLSLCVCLALSRNTLHLSLSLSSFVSLIGKSCYVLFVSLLSWGYAKSYWTCYFELAPVFNVPFSLFPLLEFPLSHHFQPALSPLTNPNLYASHATIRE